MPGMKLLLALILVMATIPVASVRASDDAAGLGGLGCVALELLPKNGAWPTLSTYYPALYDRALATLRARLPKLQVQDACRDRLVVMVMLRDFSAGTLEGYYGTTSAAAFRPVVLLATGESLRQAEVWSSHVRVAHGSPSTARVTTAEDVEAVIDEFSVAYYRAGN